MNLTKSHLIKAIKPFKSHKDIINAVFLEINKALVRKEMVMIESFGTFYIVKCNVKWGQQFHTKERIKIKPHYKVKFRASKIIENIVNERNLITEV